MTLPAPSRRLRTRRRGVALAAASGVLAAVVVPLAAPTIAPAAAASTVEAGVLGEVALEAWGELTLEPTAPPAGDETVHLYLGLTSNRAGLVERALTASDPRSDAYATWGTVTEEGRGHNASAQTIGAVTSWFAERGVSVEVDPTRSYVQGDVPVAVAEEAFAASYAAYAPEGAPAGVAIWTPDTSAITLAPALADHVDRVYGAVQLVTPPPTDAPATPPSPATTPPVLSPGGGGNPFRTGTPEGCSEALALADQGQSFGLAPNQLRAAYGLDEAWAAGFQGQGAHVAIVDQNDYLPSDLDAYRACFGVADAAPVNRHIEGDVTFGGVGSEETSLDLEVLSSIAPHVDRLDWFGVDTATSEMQVARGVFDMMVAPLDPAATGGSAPDLVSVSFGWCEPYLLGQDPAATVMMDLLDQVLATAAAAGTTYVVAAGDDGSSGCVRFLEGSEQTAPAVMWPGSSPWVLTVGGTNLDLADDNSIRSSGVWNDRAFGVTSGEIQSGGGGVSTVHVRPPWQRSADLPAGTMRLLPDVAAFADGAPGYLVFIEGGWTAVGGTSAATPMTAGSLAVLTGALKASGQPRLGFVPPLLYALAGTSPAIGSAFYDITEGNNANYGVGVYDATPGFDLASGWGSLLYDRVAAALAPPSVPADGPALSARVGGGARSLTWTAAPRIAAGEVTEYRWDVDGDGVVDRTTAGNELTVEYDGSGAVTAEVTVRTSLGRQATFAATATVGQRAAEGATPPAFTG
jgi:subtilase family serine protease